MYIVEVISQTFQAGQCDVTDVCSYSGTTRTDSIISFTLFMCLSNCLALQQILSQVGQAAFGLLR